MSLTRKLLKGMGLTDEQVDTIIEAHTDTVDGLKEQVKTYKADAEKLPEMVASKRSLRKSTAILRTSRKPFRKRKQRRQRNLLQRRFSRARALPETALKLP